TFDLSVGSVQVNQVTTAAGAATTNPRLDWHALGAVAGLGVPAFSDQMTAQLTFHAKATIGFNLLNFVSGGGTVEVVKTTVDTNAPALTDASLLELGLTDVHASVGDPNSVHLDLTGASLALAILSPPAPTAPATDPRRWIALK